MMSGLKGLLIRHEGIRLKVYDDATGAPIVKGYTLKGNPTIGIGRELSKNGITYDEADALYCADIIKISKFFDQYLGWWKDLTSVRQQVLFSVAYNTGRNGLLRFVKMLAALENQDYDLAADELLDSKAARHLPSRYKELSDMLRTG